MGSATSTPALEVQAGATRPSQHNLNEKSSENRPTAKSALPATADQRVSSSTDSPAASEHVIVAEEFRPLELESIKDVNYNVKEFRFKFPDAHAQLQRAIACFYFVRAEIDGEAVVRPYTPVSPVDARGYLTLLVKIYEKPYGKMGNHICSLKPGDTLDFKGPLAKVDYAPNKFEHVAMLAGGSGITPMYQMIQAIMQNPEDSTKITLLFSNRTERDVLLEEDLRRITAPRRDQVKLVFIVSQATEDNWSGETGHIDAEKLAKYSISPDDGKTLVLVCGPPGFTAAMGGPKLLERGQRPKQGELLGLLKEAGFDCANVYKF